MHRFFADERGIADGIAYLNAEDAGHALRVLRLEVGDEVELPDYLREEAGIPEKAKLCASVDEDEHTVTISEADYDYDLRDVPEEVLEMFRDAEICVGELEERLILGDVVYGD